MTSLQATVDETLKHKTSMDHHCLLKKVSQAVAKIVKEEEKICTQIMVI